jgi:rsbT co-antagonist protein RsbR
MVDNSQLSAESQLLRRRLIRIIAQLSIALCLIIVLDIGGDIINGRSPFSLSNAVLGCLSGGLLAAYLLAQRGLIQASGLILAATALTATIMMAAGGFSEIYLLGTLVLMLGLVMQYLSSDLLRWVSIATVICGSIALIITALLRDVTWPGFLPSLTFRIVLLGLIILVLWQFHARLSDTLLRAYGANENLTAIRLSLESQVEERTGALSRALEQAEGQREEQSRLLDQNLQQQQIIRNLSVPVLPLTERVLVMPLVGELDDQRIMLVFEQALEAVERSGAYWLIVDITGVPVIDTMVARGFISLSDAVHLLGGQVALVGIRPEVAQTIVSIGLDISAISTFSDLRSALAIVAGIKAAHS